MRAPMSREQSVRERMTSTLTNVLSNASNYPGNASVHVLGQDTAPLRGKIIDAILAEFNVTERQAGPDPFIGKRFQGRGNYDKHRRLKVLRASANQTRAGQPAKSTVYDCIEGEGSMYERINRIQAHILATKWREV